MVPINIDGNDVSGITIDGTDVQEVTMDGDVVWSATPSSGVAKYQFEQDVTDSWGSNDGTDNTSAGYTTSSQVGSYAKQFDGTDDYVDLNTNFSALHNPTTLTFGGWFRWTHSGETRPFGTGDSDTKPSLRLSLNFAGAADLSTDGEVGIRFRDGVGDYLIWGSNNSDIDDGNWHHVVFGINDIGTADVKCWVDGSDETGIGIDENPSDFTPNNNYYLGAWNQAGSAVDHSPADIDDFRVYDKMLSTAEVSNWYSTGSI